MKKEALNTFGEGMVKDLHPLNTPGNVLTNCLNGTIITSNGNEFILQNDVGNGEVHTAYLDKGYVPVGMKEHGGIIYVAAHNPITGKSQIGSFPSPQQLYEGEDLNVEPITFNFNAFVTNGLGGIPYIKLEYYKEKLFQSTETGDSKIFHPGDKFIITSSSIDSKIKQAIINGVVRLRLGVINSSGTVDYMDDKNLKLYDNGLWIYEMSTGETLADLLRNPKAVQVFSAKSSGSLILVIELKTFDTFNLIRKYSEDDSKLITVKFIGETTGVFEGKTEPDNNTVALIESGSTSVVGSVSKSAKTGTVSYKISPVSPYGVLERMAKSGIIDFDAIRNNQESFNEWRFYVTDTYIKIGWGYDFYNMDDSKDIDKIQFVFMRLSSVPEDPATEGGVYTYTMAKEYYNGSFEEVIPFTSNKIDKDEIYVVRVERYFRDGDKKIIGYKLLYTGTYFNQFYEEISDFTSGLPSGTNRTKKVRVSILSDADATVTSTGISTSLKVDGIHDWVDKEALNPVDYISEVPTIDTTVNYKYNTRKTGTYDVKVAANAEYSYGEYKDDAFVGKLDRTILNNLFGAASFGEPDNTAKTFSVNNSLIGDIDVIEDLAGSLTYDSETRTYTGTVSTSRNIIAANGPVKTSTTEVEKLMPVYETDMDASDKTKLFSFREDNGVLYCVTGDEDYCCYNSRVLSDAHTQGSYKGENGGAGSDDDGLRACLASMGNGTIGIFGGHDCDHASYRIKGTTPKPNHWYRRDSEIDSEDDFLIATWKREDGRHFPINLASRKTERPNVDANTRLIRIEKMLKCFLSQMLVVRRGRKSANFVGPDSTGFTYHNHYNTTRDIEIATNNPGVKSINMTLNNQSVESLVSSWSSKISLVNFLPLFDIYVPEKLRATIEYGDNIRFDTDSNILNCYTSAYSYFTISASQLTDEERGKIYIGVVEGTINADGSMPLKKNADGTYTRSSDFTRLRGWVKSSGTYETINLNYDINSRFITAYALNGMSGPLPATMYNEVFIRTTSTNEGRWTKGKDSAAPDMAVPIGFGSKSIFEY